MGGRSLCKNLRSFAHGLHAPCTHTNLHTVLVHLCCVGFNKVNKTLQQSSSTIKKGKLFTVLSLVPPPRYFYRVWSDDHLQYNLIDRRETWVLTVYSLQFHWTAKKAGGRLSDSGRCLGRLRYNCYLFIQCLLFPELCFVLITVLWSLLPLLFKN